MDRPCFKPILRYWFHTITRPENTPKHVLNTLPDVRGSQLDRPTEYFSLSGWLMAAGVVLRGKEGDRGSVGNIQYRGFLPAGQCNYQLIERPHHDTLIHFFCR
jgi:hypothetical protein